MNTTPFALSFLFFNLLLMPCKAYTATSTSAITPQWFAENGQQLTPINHNGQLFYLVTSETDGLLLFADNNELQAQLAGHFSQSDILLQADGHYLIAALNNNSYGVELFTLDHLFTEFSKVTTLAAKTADIETVCLAVTDNTPVVTTIDTTGTMQQHLLNNGQKQALRRVHVGAGIKSCQSVADENSIYLADEYTGLWRYPYHAESGDEKALISQVEGTEGVGIDRRGTVAWISAAEPVMMLHSGNGNTMVEINGDVKVESLRITRIDDKIVAGMYDDKSGRLFTVHFSAPKENGSSRNQALAPDASLRPFAQTAPVARFGDAADDPAIWYLNDHPMRSVILGTDKKAGLNLYDLSGQLLQHLPVGRLNNVDVRTQWQTPQGTFTLAAATNRSSKTIDIFSLDDNSRRASPLTKLSTSLNDLYGLCMYHNDDTLDVLANDTDGNYERHRLSFDNASLRSEIIETFTVPSQPEGCVADDDNAVLYYGEESTGIWMRTLTRIGSTASLIAEVGGKMKDDIEGMALFDVDGERYLVVSSQGNNRYGVYATSDDHRLLGTFDIKPNYEKHIDGVSETDGLDAISLPFSDDLPGGILVVQDGHNVMPTEPQNFKLVSGDALAAFIRSHR